MSPVVALVICLRFFSRLPLPTIAQETELGGGGFSRAAALAPLAGAIIAMVPIVILLGAAAIGLSPVLAAPLAVAGLVAATGALHEDALADCADGFGGGRDRAQKLAIMRDSRTGTFGTCAIVLSLYLRTMVIGLVAAQSTARAVVVIVAAASLSRAACFLPLLLLPAARADGLGAAAGRPSLTRVAVAFAIAVALSAAVLPLGTSLATLVGAIVLALIGTVVVCGIAWQQIGGQTGDVAGASQQVAEIAMLVVCAAGSR